MRFILLIALVDIVAARCPFGNRRCFQQLLRGQQYGQSGSWGPEFDDEDDTTGMSSWDNDDEFQTQQQQFGQYQYDEDQYQDQDDQGYCQPGDLSCYGLRQQSEGWQQQGGAWQQQDNAWQQSGGWQQQCRPNHQLLQQLEQPNCHLASKLYKQAKQENDDLNTVVSPAALQITMAALQKGARGSTRTQLKRVQCPNLSQQQCQQAHAALIRSLKATNNVQQTQRPGGPSGQQKAKINCPTVIIVDQKNQAQRQFINAVQKCLGGQVKTCSFKHSPQQCRQQVNSLIRAKTNQKLNAVMPPQAATTNTKMVAISAMQLQAKWSQQFRQQQTTRQTRCYPLNSKQPKQCQVIQSQGNFNYYEDGQVQVVGIPTQQQELTMYLIVPKDLNGLTEVEKQQIQIGQQLKQLLDSCDQQTQYLKVQLPKFQAKHKLDAKQMLLKQGVQDCFDSDTADFSGITGQQQQQLQQQQGTQLHLNKLIHQATIKITEQGISSCSPQGSPQISFQDLIESQQSQQWQSQQWQPQQYDEVEYGNYEQNQYERGQYGPGNQVKANRAFAFAIKHNPSNQIVLVGRVVDPTQKPQPEQQGGQFPDQYSDIIDEE